MSNDNVAIISGRIHSVEQHKGVFYHEVQLPAMDEYSHPGWAKVEASYSLGSVNSVVKVRARIKGYRETFTIKSGQRAGQQGSSVSSTFVAVEEKTA
jgi:hypothetical protein